MVSEYPCSNCGCWSVEAKTDCEYYWVSFRVVLVEESNNYNCKNCKCILIQVIDNKEETSHKKEVRNCMALQPISLEIGCPYCQNSIIGELITCELKNPENYLEGLIFITIYICLRCQTIVDLLVRDFTLENRIYFAISRTW